VLVSTTNNLTGSTSTADLSTDVFYQACYYVCVRRWCCIASWISRRTANIAKCYLEMVQWLGHVYYQTNSNCIFSKSIDI